MKKKITERLTVSVSLPEDRVKKKVFFFFLKYKSRKIQQQQEKNKLYQIVVHLCKVHYCLALNEIISLY